MNATEIETPRAWVGCLACYNAGNLVGEWFDGTSAPTEMDGPDGFNASVPTLPGDHYAEAHEELWIFDHENYAGMLQGECSPADARKLAELIDACPLDVAIVSAYCSAFGADPLATLEDPSEAEESYQGEWSSREEFAQSLADDLGFVQSNEWPASYIDWERAARDLFMDYADEPAPGGCIYVFRVQ